MDKNKLKQELATALRKEMSGTGTGASVTAGDGAGVATKYAFGKRDNKGTPSDWKAAPSIPNRKSKAMDYKELWEGELTPGVKYDYKGDSGFISTGGSSDPKNWKFLGDKGKYPYLSVKADLVPSEKQPGKYDGAFDYRTGGHLDEIDANDPVLMKVRAAAYQKSQPKSEPVKTINPDYKAIKNADKIKALLRQRNQLMMDMEQEAEPEGGPIADRYGGMLNKIDRAIAMLKGQGENNPYMSKADIDKRAAMINEAIHIGTDTKTDSDVYFEPSTGTFSINVIDAAGNRNNKLQVNTIDDVLAKFPNWKWTKEGEMEFQPEEQDDNEDSYDWYTNTNLKEADTYDSLRSMLKQLGAEEDSIKVLVKAVEMGALKPSDAITITKKALGVNEDLQEGYKAGDIIHFKDGEDWKVIKVKDKVNKLVIKPHNEKAKENNTSLEIDVDMDYVKKNLNEGYARFRNESKTRTKPEQFHSAVKQVKQKVNEINRLFEYMNRLQSELSESEGGLKYKKYTEKSIQQIKESTKSLFLKSTKLK
jgi:hypothetical protein